MNPRAFGSGRFGVAGVFGLGDTAPYVAAYQGGAVPITGAVSPGGTVNPVAIPAAQAQASTSPQGNAVTYSLYGALAGSAAMMVVLWRKHPKSIRGVSGISMVLPFMGVLAGQMLALRKA